MADLTFGQQVGANAISSGGQALLGYLFNRGANSANRQQNAFNRQLTLSELNRRHALQGMAAPSLLRALGYNEEQAQQMAGQLGAPASFGADSGMGQSGGSKAATVLGAAGTGLGIAAPFLGHAAAATGTGATGASAAGSGLVGALGLPAWGIPVLGAGLAGAGLIASQIGKGRRTANDFVQHVENPFGQALAQISQMAATNPQQAATRLASEYRNFKQQVAAWQSQGGNKDKVAGQAEANPQLQQTLMTLAKQLNVNLGAL